MSTANDRARYLPRTSYWFQPDGGGAMGDLLDLRPYADGRLITRWGLDSLARYAVGNMALFQDHFEDHFPKDDPLPDGLFYEDYGNDVFGMKLGEKGIMMLVEHVPGSVAEFMAAYGIPRRP